MDVRECIEPVIEQKGLKKGFVAEKSGLTQQQLCDIIAKRRKLDANELFRICDVIGVNPTNLLSYAINVDQIGKEGR